MYQKLVTLLLFLGCLRADAQIVYADYESAGLNFLGLDGVLTAPVANPGANSINGSANCAQYVKSGAHAYSLILADNGAPFDLSMNSQFQIDVYATAPTQLLFKLEGSGGGFEVTKNIAVVNAWQTYTFDFSAQAANGGLSKIVMFFDPGVETSADTYYFDNVRAVPDPCPTAVPDPNLIDDFECNRNGTYSVGWDSVTVVNNPDPTGVNTSFKVGRYADQAGPGTEYYPLILDYQNPIDLSVRNRFSCKVWAPKAGTLLLKLEGGPNPAQEVGFPISATNTWANYTVDFSSQVGKGHNKFVIFFNAGQNGEVGDIYYIDDIKLAPLPPLEDFQSGLSLGWQALDQNDVLHGTFTGPTDNPNPSGVNTSTLVGCYTKGVSAFSTLQGISLNNFDLSALPQFNLDVLSPNSGGTVTMRLNSPTQGNKDATATISTPGAWETLSFDFSAFSGIADFGEVRILFNAGAAAAGESWCFDNLVQSKVTIDPCVGTVPVPNIIDDYECQRNYTYGAGNDKLSVINNPQLTPQNGSLKVGLYKDPANDPWTALCVEFPNGIDFSLYNQLSMQVWGPEKVPVLIKLEGGSSPAKEIWDTLRTANAWYKFNVDFSSQIGQNHKRLCIFMNGGVSNPETNYYLDNLRWARAGYNGCISDYETAASSISNFKYFANGSLEADPFEVISNPNPTGINVSSKVGKFVKAGDALPFAGMYADLDAPIDFKGVKTAKAKVHMDHIGNFAVKLEGSQTGAPAFEIPVANSITNAWEELTFNFAAVPDNGEYKRLTVFFDLGIDATGTNVTSYFDDLVMGAGACGGVGTFSPTVAPLRVSPNPANDMVFVENLDGIARFDVTNMLGQRVASINTTGDARTDIDVSRLPAGVYTLTAYTEAGILTAKAKFVKQ